MIKFDSTNQANAQVLLYLNKRDKTIPLFALPDEVDDPYLHQGSHPEVVERVWDQLGSALPVDCRCVFCGTPALIHPETGIVLAFCNGTAYCLRLTPALVGEALKKGARTYIEWSSSRRFDIADELGPQWVGGTWIHDEADWCKATYKSLEIIKP